MNVADTAERLKPPSPGKAWPAPASSWSVMWCRACWPQPRSPNGNPWARRAPP